MRDRAKIFMVGDDRIGLIGLQDRLKVGKLVCGFCILETCR